MSSNKTQIDDNVKKQLKSVRAMTSALPTPLETWEQQQQRLSRISSSAKPPLARDQLGRRILPLPGVGGSGGTRKVCALCERIHIHCAVEDCVA